MVVALLGHGTVGGGVYELLKNRRLRLSSV